MKSVLSREQNEQRRMRRTQKESEKEQVVQFVLRSEKGPEQIVDINLYGQVVAILGSILRIRLRNMLKMN